MNAATATTSAAVVRRYPFGQSVQLGILVTALGVGGPATMLMGVLGGDVVRGLLVLPVAVLLAELVLRRVTGRGSAGVLRNLSRVHRTGFAVGSGLALVAWLSVFGGAL